MPIVGAYGEDEVGSDAGAVYYFTRSLADCNNNGIDDTLDITNGTSEDCNGNGFPDECDIDAGPAKTATITTSLTSATS